MLIFVRFLFNFQSFSLSLHTKRQQDMKFKSSKEAAEWMKAHPEEHVYDQYGNYAAYFPDSYDGPHVEYNYEIDIENWIWDFDRMSLEEFVNRFSDTLLETQE